MHEDDELYCLDDFDDECLGVPTPRKTRKAKAPDEEEVKARAMRTHQRAVMRKALSEQHMNDVLDWHLEEGCAYHVISGGDVDFLTYMRGIIKQHPLEYCLFSTWCMAMEDAQEIVGWMERGMLKRADVYVGEIFIQHYMAIFEFLAEQIPARGGGRLCMTRNHAKVMVGYWRDGEELKGVVVTSSANINTNPRIEQAVITVDREVADFYKAFFDDLKPKNKWPIPWRPWEADDAVQDARRGHRGHDKGQGGRSDPEHNDNEGHPAQVQGQEAEGRHAGGRDVLAGAHR